MNEKSTNRKGIAHMKKSIKAFGKRLFTAILTAALLVGSFAVCASAVTVDKFGDDHEAYDERLYGDVNLDWEVNAVDYMLVKRAVLGTYVVLEQDYIQTDINQDGKIDATDCLLIKRSVLGTIAPLGFVPLMELSPKATDALTDEELYEKIDKEIAEADGSTTLLFSFRRIKRETQAAAVLGSLGLPDDLCDPSIYFPGFSLWNGLTLMVFMYVPPEISLRETMFKLYRCAEIGGILVGDDWTYAP